MTKRLIIGSGIFFTIALTAVLCLPVPALAVSTITLSPAGDGVFLLQGVGIEDASAFEINVFYDATTLSNPRITEGPLISGAMTAVNPNVPGVVRLVAIRISPVRGSGVIATLTFARTGSSPGRISAVSAKLANVQGAPLPAQVQVTNPSDTGTAASNPSQNTEQAAQTPAPPAPPSATTPAVIIAAPPAAGEESRARAEAPRTQSVSPESAGENPKEPAVIAKKTESSAAAGSAAPEAKIYTQKSVLDLFREYRGERTSGALLSLFEKESMIGFRQEPSVALADGKSTVKVIFISPPGNRTASDIAVMGARLISLTRDPDNTNTWIAELLPARGEYRISLVVPMEKIVMIYPVTVAPRVNLAAAAPGPAAPADFDRFLTDQGTKNADLNGDGRHDYIDDYIFAVNYLASHHLSRR